jgi:nucleoside-diphosphate-sugar epimerase
MVYLSTTGVYGDAREVDENTSPAAGHPRERLRLSAEAAVAAGPWSSMILRPAAIYGPGRGVHESMRRGRFRLAGEGSNYVSRIHVDDLAALAEAALLSGAGGAWPVADEEPSTAREMAAFCADLLGLPLPPSIPRAEAHHTRRADRRVDGRAVFRRLGVTLRYPSFRTGVPASLEE